MILTNFSRKKVRFDGLLDLNCNALYGIINTGIFPALCPGSVRNRGAQGKFTPICLYIGRIAWKKRAEAEKMSAARKSIFCKKAVKYP